MPANHCPCAADMLNVYITLTMLGWGSAPRQVLLLDNHRPASLDLLWPVVAAGQEMLKPPFPSDKCCWNGEMGGFGSFVRGSRCGADVVGWGWVSQVSWHGGRGMEK